VYSALVYNSHSPTRPTRQACTTTKAGSVKEKKPNRNLHPTDFIAYTLTVSNTFNSLFKVLFTFPSRYLCPIGFLGIFSLGRNLPPVKIALSSNPTLGKRSVRGELQALYGALTLHGATFQWTSTWATRWTRFHKPQLSLDEPERLQAWAFPRSLAVTRGILFSFFSSPYLYA